MRKRKWMIGAAGLVVLSLGISVYRLDGYKTESKTSEILAGDIKQIAHDISSGTIKATSASVDQKQLRIVNADATEEILPLPGDEFFISIAPFVTETHPCTIHNLVKCRGELANKNFNVRVEYSDGSVVLDQVMHSMPNGFIDLWLPRDKGFKIQISYEGRTAQSELSTFENDKTCLTTMQLA